MTVGVCFQPLGYARLINAHAHVRKILSGNIRDSLSIELLCLVRGIASLDWQVFFKLPYLCVCYVLIIGFCCVH